jgi:uncharacterized protein YgiM (DUF1202 family)
MLQYSRTKPGCQSAYEESGLPFIKVFEYWLDRKGRIPPYLPITTAFPNDPRFICSGNKTMCARIKPMMKLVFSLTVLALLAAACGTSEPATVPPASVSPTELPTGTVTPTKTPTLPAPTTTPRPIEGTLTIKVNVRSGPGTSYDSLGLLNAGEKIQIVSQDSLGKWYQILYSSAPQGRGWVSAQYVQVAAGAEIPLDATSTPTGPTGHVTQRLNVRSGPGTTFNLLGILQSGEVVSLTGKNGTASWFQINYASGPAGHGWITAQYVQTDAAADLTVLDDYGTPVTSGLAGTPSGPAMTPTPTIGPAFADGDSQATPAVQVTFSATGTRQFVYSSQVSAPYGDAEDWVEFTPYAASGTNARLTFSLTCSGNDVLTVELWQGGSALSGWGGLECGDLEKPVTLPAGQAYQIRLAPTAGNGLRLVDYVLTVRNRP